MGRDTHDYSSYNACIMVLPKISFALLCTHSFLHHHERDNLGYEHYGFIQFETSHVFLLGMLDNMFEVAENETRSLFFTN